MKLKDTLALSILPVLFSFQAQAFTVGVVIQLKLSLDGIEKVLVLNNS